MTEVPRERVGKISQTLQALERCHQMKLSWMGARGFGEMATDRGVLAIARAPLAQCAVALFKSPQQQVAAKITQFDEYRAWTFASSR
jgi:hypothetical protein